MSILFLRNKIRTVIAIRASIMRWYRSLLAVRGPAPAAKAAMPDSTPPGTPCPALRGRHPASHRPQVRPILFELLRRPVSMVHLSPSLILFSSYE
jgi:hypothetical protein